MAIGVAAVVSGVAAAVVAGRLGADTGHGGGRCLRGCADVAAVDGGHGDEARLNPRRGVVDPSAGGSLRGCAGARDADGFVGGIDAAALIRGTAELAVVAALLRERGVGADGALEDVLGDVVARGELGDVCGIGLCEDGGGEGEGREGEERRRSCEEPHVGGWKAGKGQREVNCGMRARNAALENRGECRWWWCGVGSRDGRWSSSCNGLRWFPRLSWKDSRNVRVSNERE